MNHEQDESPLSGRDGSRGPDDGHTADVGHTDRRRPIKLNRAFSIRGALAMLLGSVLFAAAPVGAEDAKDNQGTGGAAATLLAEQSYNLKDVVKPNLGVQGQTQGAGTLNLKLPLEDNPKVRPESKLPISCADPKGRMLPGDIAC